MAQVFSRATRLGFRLLLVALLLGAALAITLLASPADRDLPLRQPVSQPIPFSHKHHVSDDGIDCRYCHATVETSAFAGLPSSQTCLTCHSQLYTDAPMLQPLHQSAARGEPIRWRRVHKLPDFVYFNHSIHVAKGVGCVECHGRVDQMPLTWRVASLNMQWCLACHRDPVPHLRPAGDLFTLDAPRASPAQAAQLARDLHLESNRRMTDCSTCHR